MARPDKPHRARPRDNPFSPSSNSQNAAFRFGDTTNPRADFTFRHRHAPRIYERDLLTRQPNTIETSVLASNHGENRFKDPNDLSDSGEEDMEYSSDDHPVDRAKRRKLDEPNTTTTSSPATTLKWSNPDPYTACPPPEETVGKRIDMVKYIRKARNEAAVAPAPSAAQEDFISFDFADDPTFGPPPNAPLGPKADMGSANSRDDVHIVAVTEIGGRSTLGKRKRDDKPDRDTLRQRVARAGGAILDDWAQEGKSSTTPWLRPIKPTDSAIVALHREIVDFYEWVRPREFEFDVRQGVIDKLSKELRRKEHGNLEPFGSYAAGLFLPIGDMDLVYNLSRWRGTEEPVSKNMIYRYRDFLERIDVAEPGSILPIAHAKVPIIKYVDKATGLRVDLSFNSRTGTSAVSTFQKWKAAYPAMPIIVSVVKQMLMIRGLNDVATGGIGGFSIICLVTSFLQHLPGHRACNLGEVLVEFCNLYGNLFDRSVVGIRLDPPSYVDKVSLSLFVLIPLTRC